MPETRYITEYDKNGNIVNQIPYEVSNEELEMERAEKVVAELSAIPDAELTTTRLRKLVKALARLRR